jgi:hypothetical protein
MSQVPESQDKLLDILRSKPYFSKLDPAVWDVVTWDYAKSLERDDLIALTNHPGLAVMILKDIEAEKLRRAGAGPGAAAQPVPGPAAAPVRIDVNVEAILAEISAVGGGKRARRARVLGGTVPDARVRRLACHLQPADWLQRAHRGRAPVRR